MLGASLREREFFEPMRSVRAMALHLGAPLAATAQLTRALLVLTTTAPMFRRVRRLSAKRA